MPDERESSRYQQKYIGLDLATGIATTYAKQHGYRNVKLLMTKTSPDKRSEYFYVFSITDTMNKTGKKEFFILVDPVSGEVFRVDESNLK
ncbi:hypothetical protein lacNasYZ03_07580 [Lactobacillus nasalidis]|uniref:PepSY domain-containing protein n=1 Tax=Lactobacillus nasalidis TaxID=2797258 RepID=A0ABQ3W6D6_9LACO|nr:hypothetical protein [Lactobacillus nasalidis]GHV98242.1 hypothetical protein lacNasYZ01_14240 [Lactobacillus nasalidis]GHV98841.1 hypothetical protein lacNasYZ02_02710 [Lactobacillus nasalidis]GHW01071.1 hypothetical protein lacNasYZ03_07580 [Lactobacillus nasalidis]